MPAYPFELYLALRYLRPKRTLVSHITLISVIGVMLGVAVLIIVMSVMSGFDADLRQRILGFNAHLKIFYFNAPMPDYNLLAERVRTHPRVKAAAPFVVGQVLVKTQPEEGSPRTMGPWVLGVDETLEAKISVLPERIAEGKFEMGQEGVLFGQVLAEQMRVEVEDYVAIYSIPVLESMLASLEQGEEIAVLPDDFEVKGIFDVGYYEYNERFIICSLATAQSFFGLAEKDLVHGLRVILDEPEAAASVRLELRHLLGTRYRIMTWMEENSGILEALIVEKNVMFYLLFFIMIVAAFGIASGQITFVVQKTREIGMLKAMGASNGQIMWVFLSQSLVVGLVGVAAGLCLGLLAVHYRNPFLFFMRNQTGWELFPDDVYGFSELPALVVPGDITLICGGSLLICLMAGLIPSCNASRLHPVEALRHE